MVQRSAIRTAADRGAGPLVSLSPHVTVGACGDQLGSMLENGHVISDDAEPDQEDPSTDRHDRYCCACCKPHRYFF